MYYQRKAEKQYLQMTSALVRLGLLCSVLFHVFVLTQGTNEAEMKKRSAKGDRMKLLREYAKFEEHVTDTITSIFKNLHQEDDCAEGDKDANGVCRKSPLESPQDFSGTDNSLLDRVENIQEILLTLLPLVTMTTSKSLEKNLANVPRPIVRAGLNESVHLSCDSKGQRLRLCIWEHQMNGERQMKNVDEDGIQNGGKAGAEKLVHEGVELSVGQCGLRIQTSAAEDIDHWSCTLVTENGAIFTGAVTLVVTASVNQKRYASVAQAVVAAKLSTSVNFSCDSHGEPLSLCLWERNVGGEIEAIVIDGEVEHEDDCIPEGLSFFGGGLQKGECGLRIHSVKEDDLGPWRCSLLTTSTSQVFSGEVNVRLEGRNARIHLATYTSVLKLVSNTSARQSTSTAIISNRKCCLRGLAVDTMRRKLYWTSGHGIHRSKMEGTEIETLLETDGHGNLYGLGFEFITGNIYVTSENGSILVCDGTLSRNFTCATVLFRNKSIRGVALNPNEGSMYWGECCGSIQMAAMDGSNVTTFVSGVRWAFGIVVDFASSRLYWADYSARQIQSCRLDDRIVVTLTKVSEAPWGIAVVDNTVYWSLPFEKRVESMETHNGGDVHSVYNGTENIIHLTSPDVTLVRNRAKPCERQACTGVCVLNPTSYTCLG